jgi:hypothetical protein
MAFVHTGHTIFNLGTSDCFLLLYFIHSFMAPIRDRKIISINETRKTRGHPETAHVERPTACKYSDI